MHGESHCSLGGWGWGKGEQLCAPAQTHLVQLLFRAKAKAVVRVGAHVRPLPKLLRRLCEDHTGPGGGAGEEEGVRGCGVVLEPRTP